MSHIAKIELHVTDLEALKAACAQIGLEFVEGQKTYRWYGRSIGGQVPQGFTTADLGHCEHAIRVNGNPRAYEIGVVRRRDGKPGYVLHLDEWANGYGLVQVAGTGCAKLKQAYAEQVACAQLRKQGFRFTRQVKEDGRVQLIAQR